MDLQQAINQLTSCSASSWIQYLGTSTPSDFGDSPIELNSLHEKTGITFFPWLGLVTVQGKDQVSWLQGQVSNDVKSLLPGQGCYAVHCTPKGKIKTDLVILSDSDAIFLALPKTTIETLVPQLSKFILMEDVELIDQSSQGMWVSLQGPGATKTIQEMLDLDVSTWSEFNHSTIDKVRIAKINRLGQAGFDLWIPQEQVHERLQTLTKNVQVVGHKAFETMRIEQGLPQSLIDFTDAHIPQEAGIDEPRGVSYQKGCFVGQETISRLHHLGKPNKNLARLTINHTETIPSETKLYAGEKEVGMITSSAINPVTHENVALGFLSRKYLESPTPLLARWNHQEAEVHFKEIVQG